MYGSLARRAPHPWIAFSSLEDNLLDLCSARRLLNKPHHLHGVIYPGLLRITVHQAAGIHRRFDPRACASPPRRRDRICNVRQCTALRCTLYGSYLVLERETRQRASLTGPDRAIPPDSSTLSLAFIPLTEWRYSTRVEYGMLVITEHAKHGSFSNLSTNEKLRLASTTSYSSWSNLCQALKTHGRWQDPWNPLARTPFVGI